MMLCLLLVDPKRIDTSANQSSWRSQPVEDCLSMIYHLADLAGRLLDIPPISSVPNTQWNRQMPVPCPCNNYWHPIHQVAGRTISLTSRGLSFFNMAELLGCLELLRLLGWLPSLQRCYPCCSSSPDRKTSDLQEPPMICGSNQAFQRRFPPNWSIPFPRAQPTQHHSHNGAHSDANGNCQPHRCVQIVGPQHPANGGPVLKI